MNNIRMNELRNLIICIDSLTKCECVLDRDVYECEYFDIPPNVHIEYIDIKDFKDGFITHITIYVSMRSFQLFRFWADGMKLKRGSV